MSLVSSLSENFVLVKVEECDCFRICIKTIFRVLVLVCNMVVTFKSDYPVCQGFKPDTMKG